MADPVDVAIQKALTDRATAFATAQGLVGAIAYPSVAFTPPTAKSTANPPVYGKWLQVSFLPVPSISLGYQSADNQHYGIFQISVFYGFGAGEYAPKRIAAAAAAFFARGTIVRSDGFDVEIYDPPSVGLGLKDDPWWMVPVTIPYRCFAPNS